MNQIEALLQRFALEGIQVWPQDGKLRYAGPPQRITPELLQQLRTYKDALLHQLSEPTYAPVSDGQRGLWFIQQQAPGNSAYTISFAYQINSTLDIGLLCDTIQLLVNRHSALRTRFLWKEETVQQCIDGYQRSAVEVVDAKDWCEPDRPQQLRRWHERPFDLSSGPLFRVVLFCHTEQNYTLLLSVHHIVIDGWSFYQLIDEVFTFYGALRRGAVTALPVVQQTYADYVAWQQRLLQREGERLFQYWQQQLSGELPVLQLPTDYPRPTHQSLSGVNQQIHLSTKLTEQLQQVARQHGCTLYMLLLAAYQLFLYRYSGQEELLIGLPMAGRSRPEFAEIIGYFTSPVVIRSNLAGNPSFVQLLTQVKKQLLSALEHQDYPFMRLVERLNPQRSPGVSPIYQVSFTLQKPQRAQNLIFQRERNAKADLVLTPISLPLFAGQEDLALELMDIGNGLYGYLKGRNDLFTEATLARMAANFQKLLESLVAEEPPGIQQPISNLALLTDTEYRQVVHEWNSTRVEYPQDQCIHQLFEQQVARTPDAVAVVIPKSQEIGQGDTQSPNLPISQSLTYAELNARANQLAHHLQSLGVGPDVLVSICVERSLEMVVGLLAILKAGGAYVPLDPSYPAERLAFMLQDANPPVLLTQSHLLGQLPTTTAQVICLDQDGGEIATHSCSNPVSQVQAENLAYVIYTSGSTGQPKGALITHQALCNHTLWMQAALDLDTADVVLQKTPFSFDASITEFYAALTAGGQLILAKQNAHRDVEYLIQTLVSQAVTTLVVVPTQLEMLLTQPAFSNCTSLKHILCGGEALPLSLCQRLAQVHPAQLYNFYGPTETCVDTLYWPYTPDATTVTIGRPIANTQVYLLDSQQQPVPIGVPAELHIGGVQVGRGYLNRPELTQEKFIANPFGEGKLYKTGDLARWLPDGTVEYLGRIDQQVKLRGFRIELGEIESVLSQHSDVQETVVIAREDTPGEKRLVAYVVIPDKRTGWQDDWIMGDGTAIPSSHHPVILSALRSHLHGKLPEYMIPSAFVLLDALPLTPNGKLDRKALPVPQFESHSPAGLAAPRNANEAQMVAIWRELLKVPAVGIDENFFDLGGHSLLATQVVSRIRQSFAVELPLRTFFATPTVAALSSAVTVQQQSQQQALRPPLLPVGRTRLLPLSYAQQRLWFLAQMEGSNRAYHIPLIMEVTGVLDVVALQASWRAVVQRHEILRTCYVWVDEQVVQSIQPSTAVALTVETLLASNEAAIASWLAEKIGQPFDLAAALPWRLNLLQLADQRHLLLLTLHHIASDGWSMKVLLDEIAQHYIKLTEQTNEQPASLSPLPVQYADYAVWQREWLQGEVLETQLAFWRKHLAGAPALLELPTDHPRPAVQSYRGTVLPFQFEPQLSEELNHLSAQAGVTLFMSLLAAFKVLLYRYSGQTDLVVGTPIANRTLLEVEPLIGMFVNTLAIRSQLDATASFAALLAQVRETLHAAYDHQDLPFEMVVETLQPERSLSHAPLFQVMFVLQNDQQYDMALPGLTLRQRLPPIDTTKFDLTLSLIETPQGLLGWWEYNSDLFEPATIQRMSGHLQTLLNGIVANPHQRLSELPLLTVDERHRLLVEWNDTQVDYPTDQCIHHLFEQQVAHTPDAVAVVMAEEQQLEIGDWRITHDKSPISNLQSLTYQELNARANQLAHHLITLGIQADTLVAVMMDRSLEMVVSLLAVLKAGGAYVPIDLTYPTERIRYMLTDSAAPILLTQSHLAVVQEAVRHIKHVIPVDTVATQLAAQATTNPQILTLPTDLAYVIYTSGSTGQPKGVMIPHLNLFNLLQWSQETLQLTPTDRMLARTSLSFDVATRELFLPLIGGAALVLATSKQQRDLQQMVMLMKHHQVSVAHFTPTLWAAMMDVIEKSGEIPELRILMSGGEALTPALANRISQCFSGTLFNSYGPTETTISVGLQRIARDTASVTLAPPPPNNSFYILNEALQPVPLNATGELCIGGIQLARGYLNRPELTAGRFIANPFGEGRLYKTGDLARWLPDGNIEYRGRLDQQVKIRGFRIELGEIEAVLSQHPDVQEAVVIAREDTPGEKRLVAYIVRSQESQVPSQKSSRESRRVTADGSTERTEVPGLLTWDLGLLTSALRSHLHGKLPEYMIPSAFVLLDALPLTPNGKLDRKALPVPDRAQFGSGKQYRAPRTFQERQLVQIWETVTGHHPISIDASFFDLGGHSLLAVQLMARIQQAFDKTLPLNLLFQHPTVEALATYLAQPDEVDSWAPLVTIQSQGNKPPFFCLPGAGGNPLYLYSLANHLGVEQPFYGVQYVGLDGITPPYATVEAAATHYLAELRRVQAQGPYYLGGHSYGGWIAFEMAQQLLGQGEAVGCLAILDTQAPTPDITQVVTAIESLLTLADFLAELTGQAHSLSADQLEPLADEARLQALLDFMIAIQLVPANTSLTPIRGLWQVCHTNVQVNYYPTAIRPLPITLFTALANSAEERIQMIERWKRYGPVTVKEIPGSHNTMMGEPHVRILAQELASLLSEATGKQ